MGDYYCDVRTIICLVSVDGNQFFWVQIDVQMMQKKETCLTYQTANAFMSWFAYVRSFNSHFVVNSAE